MSTTIYPRTAERHVATGSVTRESAWIRPSVIALALGTLVLYLWGLDRNGWANTYYAAAVQAGTQSWKALFFGSLDAGNFITVDKPPASLWLMELSARIFGLSSWSMLAPEAVAGALSVLILFFTVRRTFGPVAGLAAALAMALTPVAVVMFRYNNPDALLTLLLVASAWALVRALEGGRTRWLLLSAVLVGLAFNTKDLQAYIVLPALVITYFLFGLGGLSRRFVQLLAAGAALAISSGWWLLIVDAIPASARPYIGGSTNNTVLNLVLGYNGLGRIFGQGGPSGAAGGGAGFGGATGLMRLFSDEIGGQIAWLIPLAVVSLGVGLWVRGARPRADLARAGYVLWGLWFATHFAVFSFASGIFHPYYTVALAPGVAALVGAGVVDMWKLRERSLPGALILGAAFVGTGWWGAQLLARTPTFAPALGSLELALAVLAAVVIVTTRFHALARLVSGRVPAVAVAIGFAAIIIGPAAYSIATVGQSSAGAIPSAGPSAKASAIDARYEFTGPPPGGSVSNLPAGTRAGGAIPAGGRSGFGLALGSDVISYLEQRQGKATWLVAVQSAGEAASIELSTGRPVLAMGGFSGSDPAMTVDRLVQLVSSGQLRYVVLSGGGPGGSNSAVQQWIIANGSAVTVGSTTIYDLEPSTS